jgi:hypothetical protein
MHVQGCGVTETSTKYLPGIAPSNLRAAREISHTNPFFVIKLGSTCPCCTLISAEKLDPGSANGSWFPWAPFVGGVLLVRETPHFPTVNNSWPSRFLGTLLTRQAHHLAFLTTEVESDRVAVLRQGCACTKVGWVGLEHGVANISIVGPQRSAQR